MALVTARRCRYHDWIDLDELQSCLSCGLSLSSSDIPAPRNVCSDVHSETSQSNSFGQPIQPLPHGNYRYSPINLQQGCEVRLLTLSPGQFTDELHCNLEHVNLQLGPAYEAISYTWADDTGDDGVSRRIRCGAGDEYIGITKNCEAALRRLRSTHSERRIWIDAICIDQSNVHERNHQVHHMTAIFRSAQQVLIYLGEGSQSCRRLVEYLATDSSGLLPTALDVIEFFKRRWFHRVWVLQEVAAAKHATVICGPMTCTWDLLVSDGSPFRRINAGGHPIPFPAVFRFGVHRSRGLPSDLSKDGDGALTSPQKTSDVLDILNISRNCSSKDARDKIYAIGGLVSESFRVPLQADYAEAKTPEWVFLQVAAWFIAKGRSLEILSYVQGKSKLSMPSWVPDWTLNGIETLPPLGYQAESPPLLISRRKSLSLNSLTPPNCPLDCVLKVRGRRLGNVWTDSVIFRTPSRRSGHTTGETPYEDGNYGLGEALTSFWTGPFTPPKRLASNTLTPKPEKNDWLNNPSPNLSTRQCPERWAFWEAFAPYLRNFPSRTGQKYYFPADIPPAFGGFCQNCFGLDLLHWQTISKRFPIIEEDMWIRDSKDRRLRCLCVGGWHGKNGIDSSMGLHYFKRELDAFKEQLQRFGHRRRIFATEYSLGIGPDELQTGDIVWLLDGARNPIILRPVGVGYTVVGECYLHEAMRKCDVCSICGLATMRNPIQPNIEPALSNLVPPTDRLRMRMEAQTSGDLKNSQISWECLEIR